MEHLIIEDHPNTDVPHCPKPCLRERVARKRQVTLSRNACYGAAARTTVLLNVLFDESAVYLESIESRSIVDEPREY